MKIAVLLLCALLCLPVWAAEEDLLPTDQPLNQPVTLAVKGEALSDIMAMLSKQTGVKLRTTRDIADQKATIFVDKCPLKDVIDGLKTIFGYRFSVVNVGDRKVYELWESLSTKQAREAAMNGALAQAWQKADKRLEEIIQLSKGDPDVLKQLEAKTDRTPEETTRLALLKDAFGIGSDIADLYFRLPPETRYMQSGWMAYFDSEASEAEWRLPGDIDESLTRKMTDPSVGWPDRPSAGYNVSIGFHQRGNVLSVSGSCAGFWPERDKLWIRGTRLGGDITISRVKPERPAIQLPNEPDEGFLGKEVTFTAKELTDESGISQRSGSSVRVNRSDILSLLHRKLGLQVISDHYSVWFDWDVNGMQTVKRLLEHFVEMKTTPDWRVRGADTSVYEKTRVSDPMWGWDGSYLYMRERSPYELDAAEVPNKLLNSMRINLSNRHCLDLDDIASMLSCGRQRAATGFAPWELLLGADYNRHLILSDQADSLMSFHLYGSLSDVQRRRILAAGIGIQDMSPEQLNCLALLLVDRTKDVFDLRLVGLYVNGMRIDKPQMGDNTPVLIRVERRTSKRFVLAGLGSAGAVQRTEAASPNDALNWFQEHYPDLVNNPHFFGRDGGYVMVLFFGDGTTKEYQMTVYEPVEESNEPTSPVGE